MPDTPFGFKEGPLAEWERELLGYKAEHCGMENPHADHEWVNHPKKLTDGSHANWCSGSWDFYDLSAVESFLRG